MSKTKKVVISLILLVVFIIVITLGIYINKQVISFFLGFLYFPLFAYIIYKLKGWDKEDIDIEELKGRINKALFKLENEDKSKKQEIINILKGE